MVTLTINGQALQVESGKTVLEAAQQNNIYIPTLCHHPRLPSVGACRLCIVEIEGMRGVPPACTTPVADGMVVPTNTPAVQDLRREILSLILAEHPYTCLVCGRHDYCHEWQGTIRKAGVTTGCENCPKNGQCELQVLVEKIGLKAMPYPIAYRGMPVEREDPFFDRDYNLCVLCGRCVRVCQETRRKGVLAFTFRGPQARVGTAFNQSHLELDCEFCGACVDVCPTGALFDKRTKWEGAPTSTVTSVCPYCSVGCRLDLWVKNDRVIGVRPNADGPANRGQACMRGRFGIVEMVHAPDRLYSPLIRKDGRLAQAEWDEALQLVAEKFAAYKGDAFALLASPHLTNESLDVLQRFARQVMQTRNVDCASVLPRYPTARNDVRALLANGARSEIQKIHQAGCIVVIGANPRVSHPIVALQIRQRVAAGAKLIVLDPRETDLARRADVWLRPPLGGDARLLSDLEAEVRGQGSSGTVGQWDSAAELLRNHGPVMIVYGSGVTYYPSGAETIRAIQQLADALTPAAGVLPLLGAANALGALRLGAVAGEGDRNYAEIVAGIASGEIKALYLVGEAPALDVLDRLEFLVVQDILPSSNLEEYADVVLPATSFAEMSGTLTNLEGRVQEFPAAIPAQGDARPDWLICSQLAQRMGAAGFDYKAASEILAESSRRQAAGNRQKAEGGRQKAEGGKQKAEGSEEYPFLLITERNQFAYRGNALTERVQGMNLVRREDSVTIHPEDAARLGIGEGDLIQLASAYGVDTALAHLSAEVPAGMCFASINDAAGSDLFPARLPDIKACPVRIEKK